MSPHFYQMLQTEITSSGFTPTTPEWRSFLQQIDESTSSISLLKTLKEIDEDLLTSQGEMVVIEGKRVMLYNGNTPFALQEQSLYARGLQYAYSAIKILEWENLETDASILRDYLKLYTLNMQQLGSPHTLDSFERAQQMTADFIGLMANHIAEKRIINNPPDISDPKAQEQYFNQSYLQAFTDLNKANDLISSIQPNEDVICTYDIDPTTHQTRATISERLTFDGTETLSEIQTQPWYQQNLAKHGAWFEAFMKENHDALLHCSPVCTTRDLPNSANGWNDVSITFDSNGAILQQQASKRVAIVSPFQIRDRRARLAMAEENIASILNPTELDTIAQETHDRWGPLLANAGEITLPILHQTLVAPTFFYGADRDMIEIKTEADAAFRQNVLDNSSRTIEGTVYNFSLLETNNCINMWSPIINPRDNDLDDSNKLIQSASFLISRLHDKTKDNDVQLVLDFLNNQKRSWIMIKPFSKQDPNLAQQQAIDRVTQKLRQGNMNDSGLSPKQQNELALTMQAAVSLKKLNHETHLGHAKRRLNNAVKINGISLLSPITGVLSSPVYLGRYLMNSASRLSGYFKDKHPTTLGAVFLPTLNGYKNKQTFKSAYESIIAGQFGMVFGGCKSAYDRAGEVKVNQNAMLQIFSQTGKLPDFFDTDKAYYDYLETVSQHENAGHQSRIVASNDRIGARKLWEVLPHHYTQELTQEERDIGRRCAKFRKFGSIPTGEARESLVRHYHQNVTTTHTQPASSGQAQTLTPGATNHPPAESRPAPILGNRPRSETIVPSSPTSNSSPHRAPSSRNRR